MYDNLGAAAGVAVNPVNNIGYLAKLGHTGGTPGVTEWLPTGTQGRTLTFQTQPREIAVSQDGSLLYVVNIGPGLTNGVVSLVDTQSLLTFATITVGRGPYGIAISDPILNNSFNWLVNGSGDWDTASNWSLNEVPNHMDHQAVFDNAITSPATINIKSDITVGRLTFNNAGSSYTLQSDGTHSLTMPADAEINVVAGSHTIAAPVNFEGSFMKVGTGTLVLNGETSSGETVIDGGTLRVVNGAKGSNGVTKIGDKVGTTGAMAVNGSSSEWSSNQSITVGVDGAGELSLTNGANVAAVSATFGANSGSTGTVTVDGATFSGGSATVGDSGLATLSIVNSGSVDIQGSSNIGNATGSMGAITVDGIGSTLNTRILSVGGSGTATLVITGGGSVTSASTLPGIPSSTIAAAQDSMGTVTVHGMGSKWTNSRELRIGGFGSGSLSITEGGMVSSASGSVGFSPGSIGIVTVDGPGSRWLMMSPTSDLAIGVRTTNQQIGDTGRVTVTAGGNIQVGRKTTVYPGGRLVLDGGTISTMTLENRGVVELGGTLTATGGMTMTAGGVLKGSGSVVGNVTSSGRVMPGNSPGITTINGNYTQQHDGELEIEVGGLTLGTQHDQLRVSGTVSLNGRLDVPIVNVPGQPMYSPQEGDTITFLTAGGGVSGTFGSVVSPNLANVNPNLAIEVLYGPPGATRDVSIRFGPSTSIQFEAQTETSKWAEADSWTTGTVPGTTNIVTVTNRAGMPQQLDVVDVDGQPLNALTHQLSISSDTQQITVAVAADSSLSATTSTTISDNAVVKLNGGSLVSSNVTVANRAAIELNDGDLVGSSVEVRDGGAMRGNGTIFGDLKVGNSVGQSAVLSPGLSVGLVKVMGNYEQGAGGVFELEIKDASNAEFDALQVTGNAQLGGTLRIDASQLKNFATGERFEFITGNTRTGEFAQVASVDADDIAVAYDDDGAEFVRWIPGDMNGDKRDKIDDVDLDLFVFALMNRNVEAFKQEVLERCAEYEDQRFCEPAHPRNGGDFSLNGIKNGKVDFDDIVGFQEVRSIGSGAMTAAFDRYFRSVPEPPTAALTALLGFCTCMVRGRRWGHNSYLGCTRHS